MQIPIFMNAINEMELKQRFASPIKYYNYFGYFIYF